MERLKFNKFVKYIPIVLLLSVYARFAQANCVPQSLVGVTSCNGLPKDSAGNPLDELGKPLVSCGQCTKPQNTNPIIYSYMGCQIQYCVDNGGGGGGGSGGGGGGGGASSSSTSVAVGHCIGSCPPQVKVSSVAGSEPAAFTTSKTVFSTDGNGNTVATTNVYSGTVAVGTPTSTSVTTTNDSTGDSTTTSTTSTLTDGVLTSVTLSCAGTSCTTSNATSSSTSSSTKSSDSFGNTITTISSCAGALSVCTSAQATSTSVVTTNSSNQSTTSTTSVVKDAVTGTSVKTTLSCNDATPPCTTADAVDATTVTASDTGTTTTSVTKTTDSMGDKVVTTNNCTSALQSCTSALANSSTVLTTTPSGDTTVTIINTTTDSGGNTITTSLTCDGSVAANCNSSSAKSTSTTTITPSGSASTVTTNVSKDVSGATTKTTLTCANSKTPPCTSDKASTSTTVTTTTSGATTVSSTQTTIDAAGNKTITTSSGCTTNPCTKDKAATTTVSVCSAATPDKCSSTTTYANSGSGSGGGSGSGSGSSSKPVQIVSADSHSCILKDNSTVYCWGFNDNGEVGVASGTQGVDPSNASATSTGMIQAILASSSASLTSISVSGSAINGKSKNAHTCAVNAVGKVACWGSTVQNTQPVNPAGVISTAFNQIVSAMGFSCALDSSQNAFCWGNNSVGELGSGSRLINVGATPSAPVNKVTGAPSVGFSKIAVGGSGLSATSSDLAFACGISNDSNANLYCWGNNSYNQLLSTDAYSFKSILLNGISNVQDVALTGDHACAVLKDASVTCWGSNMGYSFSQKTPQASGEALTPITLPSQVLLPSSTGYTQNIIATVGSFNHGYTCAVLNSGDVSCWGTLPASNSAANLSSKLYSADNFLSPKTILAHDLTGKFYSISATSSYICGLKDDGTVWCYNFQKGSKYQILL